MTTYTFEHETANKNDEIIEVLPENFQDVIGDGYLSIELDHDNLVEFLTTSFEPEKIALLLEEGYTVQTLPDFITSELSLEQIEELINLDESEVNEFLTTSFEPEKIALLLEEGYTVQTLPDFITSELSLEQIEELINLDESEVNEFLANGYDIKEALEFLDDSITFDEIPDFLPAKTSYNDVKEWLDAKSRHTLDDGVLEAAYNLGIEPENVKNAYLGQYNSIGDYAESFYLDCYGKEGIMAIYSFVDWDAFGESLDIQENDGYFFRTDY